MEQTTSLKTKVFESSLKWNIENFLEYSHCDIETISSRTIPIDGTDASWTLSIHPNGYHLASQNEHFVSLSLKIKDQNPSENHYFKFEVKTDVVGHQLMSPANRHLVKSEGIYAAPREVKPVAWTVDYEKIGKRTSLELHKEKFINVRELAPFLFGGTLRLIATVSMKCVEIVDVVKADRKPDF